MFARGRGPGFDIRVGRTPVRIEWSFVVVVGVLGALVSHGGWAVLTWLAVILVGVLVHEGGHVWALSTFGRDSSVRLAWLSGMTIADDGDPLPPAASVLVSLAGPATGIAGGLLVEGLLSGHDDGVLGTIRDQSLLVNLIWSAINLLPVVPLDGGHVAREVAEWCGRRRGTTIAAIAAMTAGIVVGVVLVTRRSEGGWWVLVLSLLTATNAAFLPLTPQARRRREIAEIHAQMLQGEPAAIPRLRAHLLSPYAAGVGPGPRTTLAWTMLQAGRLDDLARFDLATVHPEHRPLLEAAVAWYRGDVSAATLQVATALADGAVDPPPSYFRHTFGRLGETEALNRQIAALPRPRAMTAQARFRAALVAAAGPPPGPTTPPR